MVDVRHFRRRFAAVVLLFFAAAAQAQDKRKADPFDPANQAQPGRLSIDRIFASGEFRSESYGGVHWLAKQPGYSRLEPSATVKGGQDIVRVDPATGKREVLVSAGNLIPKGESSPLAIDDYQWSPDEARVLIYTNSKRVWRKNTRGDYWVFDVTGRDLRKLGSFAKPATLMHARFAPDNGKVAYVHERNLYVEDLKTDKLLQVTKTTSPDIINGTFDWVYEEEFSLYDGFRWSPDGTRIAFWQLDTSGVDDYYLVNNIAGLYQQLTRFKYPKTGRPNAACKVGIATVVGVAPDPNAPVFPGQRQGDIVWFDAPGDARNHYLARMDWHPDSRAVLLQQFNRLQNTNALFFGPSFAVDRHQPLLRETDKAWVDAHDHLHWLAGGAKFTWLSERDGWRRLYVASLAKGQDRLDQIKPITPSDMDVIDVASVVEKHGLVYFYASPKNATQHYLWSVKLDGTGARQVTPADQPGWHSYDIAPDGRHAIHTYSTFDTPPVVNLISLPDHAVVRPRVENKQLQAKLKELKRRPTEFFRVDIGDGVELDGWLIKPPDFEPAKKYPVVFHVYGEPAGQTVLDRWGGSNYLWHQLLAQQGYLVMSVDNRGTPAPRGRDWRKLIYRQVGILAPRDQAEAVKALQKRWPFVDPGRVGVWGWSGGGSMSLNAIFRYPDLYHTALAIAPVPNQRYYDTIYQERYMGLPEDNPAGYRDGSPITHAHRLKGNLLLVHGTADDNVHYAGTEALVDELVAHNKHFTMMAYPNRSHGLSEGRNTRRHLYGLLTRYLEQNLLAGGR